MSKYKTPKCIQQSLKPDAAVFAKLLCGKNDFRFVCKFLTPISVLLTVESVRTTAKYRGGINVLCNEVFPVRIPSRDLFVAAECDQMPVSCHVYTFTLIEFGVVFRRNDLKRIFPIQLQAVEKKL